jgi:hypothetical protein
MRDALLVVTCVALVACWVTLLAVWRQARASKALVAALLERSERLTADQQALVAEAERLTRALNGDFDA